jgi:hypothetical protein
MSEPWLLRENEKLRNLLRELIDPDPCQYDHHDYCQSHSLHERPCPHQRAKELLGVRENNVCSKCGVARKNCQPGGQWYSVCPFDPEGGDHDWMNP